MCEKHVFSASVEQNERSQSLVWVSTPQRDNLFCFLLSGTIIVGFRLSVSNVRWRLFFLRVPFSLFFVGAMILLPI